MTKQQKLVSVLLIAASLICCINSQRISIPLKLDNKDQFFITVKYGSEQCEKNMGLSLGYCSNVITEKAEQSDDHCGSKFIVDNTFTQSKDYIAPFQIGDTQANLYFSIPTDPQNYNYGTNILCFGYQSYLEQRNTLIELFQQGKLTEERIYFNLNAFSQKSENGIVGSIDIGAPNHSLIKKGSQMVELQRYQQQDGFSVISKEINLKYFNQKLDSRSIVFIDINSPFTKLTNFAFSDILKIYDQLNIKYSYFPEQDFIVILPSIDQLQDLHISFLQKNNTPFQVSLKPAQYTRILPDGQYQLLIQPLFYTSSISLGYTIFESYYIGFDLPHQVILIAEKDQTQSARNNNFRGFNTSI